MSTTQQPPSLEAIQQSVEAAIAWIVRAQRPDGALRDAATATDVNDSRHALATLALWQATETPGGDQWTDAAENATRFLRKSCERMRTGGTGYGTNRKVRLGGQAIAILALLERRRVTGDQKDDQLIQDLGIVLQRMEQPGQPGKFFQSIDMTKTRYLTTPISESSPGQTLCSLARLNVVYPDDAREALFKRSLDYQLNERDGDVLQLGKSQRLDLWLVRALSEMPDGLQSRPSRSMIELQLASARRGVHKAIGLRTSPVNDQPAEPLARTAVRLEVLNAIRLLAARQSDFVLSAECSQQVEKALPFFTAQAPLGAAASALNDMDWLAGPHTTARLDDVAHALCALISSTDILEMPETEDDQPREKAPVRDSLRTGVQSVIDAAKRRNIPVRAVSVPSQRVELGSGAYQHRYWGLSLSTDGDHGVKIAQDKVHAKRRLAAAGIPTPAGYGVRSVEQALARAERLGYPVVLKPRSGNKGHDVYIEIETDEELERAWKLLSRIHPRGGALIEQFVAGEEYRVLVIGGKVAAVNHRIPPSVIGDGVSTICELVDRENARPERGPGGTGSALCHILIDDQTHELLAKTGRSLDTVLPAGERQLVRRASNASGGGSTAEVTALVHPDNAFICETAARVCELGIAGVDFIAPDITRSVIETGGGIIEVNSSPGLHDHFLPGSGTPIDVGSIIIDALYPAGMPTRAPLILVIGGDLGLVRAIDSAFAARGMVTGVVSNGEVEVRGVRLATHARDAELDVGPLLNNPNVEIAIAYVDALRTTVDPEMLPYVDVVVLADGATIDEDALRSIPEPAKGWIIVGNDSRRVVDGDHVTVLPATTSPETIAAVVEQLSLPHLR